MADVIKKQTLVISQKNQVLKTILCFFFIVLEYFLDISQKNENYKIIEEEKSDCFQCTFYAGNIRTEQNSFAERQDDKGKVSHS